MYVIDPLLPLVGAKFAIFFLEEQKVQSLQWFSYVRVYTFEIRKKFNTFPQCRFSKYDLFLWQSVLHLTLSKVAEV